MFGLIPTCFVGIFFALYPFLVSNGGAYYNNSLSGFFYAVTFYLVTDLAQRKRFCWLRWVILGVFIWWVLGRTTSGFRIETVGRNRHAAWYSGIPVKRTVVSAMVISGAIAGLGGAIETLGITYRYEPAFNLGLGFDGITIALLGRVHPIGIIPGAILIGGMRAGAATMQFDAGVAPEIVDLLMALILLFVTAPLITRFFKNSSNKSMTSGWGN
jgi:simple sugar transport system permease protein